MEKISNKIKSIKSIKSIKQRALDEIKKAKNLADLEKLRVKYLGRKSELVGILRTLKDLPFTERKDIGKIANQAREEIESIIKNRETAVKNLELNALEEKEKIDITYPGKKIREGHLHPLTKVREEIEEIFMSMGFLVVDGREIEDEFHNFDALNIPKDHPARDMWDTFWLKDGNLLRTHTSSVQIRFMEENKPPFRMIAPGRCYRYEQVDASHEAVFNQVEGLMIEESITLANLKSLLSTFMRIYYGKEIRLRWQPSYFPFVEPGLELMMGCTVCGMRGCSVCKQSGWIEVIPCGMVHTNVLKYIGIDPDKWQGFAFGMGLDRLTMMRHKIDDIRLFYSGDLRFLEQF